MIPPMMTKIYNLLLCLFALLISQELNGAPSSFTLLVYMNGSNLETTHKQATADISEILSAMEAEKNTCHDSLNVVLLLGGTRQWHTGDTFSLTVSPDSLTCAVITRNSIKTWQTFERSSMGNPATLSQFLRIGQSAFPADNYGLIFWNHGSGSVGGFGYDECYPDDRFLSLREIGEALESSRLPDNKKYAFIGFDACLMATLETASVLSPYADYMIASQELEPGGGWDYRRVIPLLASYSTSADTFYENMVRSYVATYKGNDKDDKNKQFLEDITLSVTRLDAVPALTASVGQFFSHQLASLSSSAFPRFSKARSQSQSFGMPAFTFSGPDMTDLLDLCNRLAEPSDRSLLDDIRTRLNNAVVCSGTSDLLNPNSVCGLSLYFPCYNFSQTRSLEEYYQSGFSPDYLHFVQEYVRQWQAGYTSTTSSAFPDKELPNLLSTDMILHTRKIYAVLLSQAPDGRWLSYGMDGDGVTLNSLGQIESQSAPLGQWNGKWIRIGGKNVAAYMTFADSRSLHYTVPVLFNGERSDLILRYDEKNPGGVVVGVRRHLNDQTPDKGITTIKKNDHIVYLCQEFQPDDDASIRYQPVDSIVAKKTKDLRVNLTSVPSGIYRYGYCVVDLYGRKHYTRFTEFKQ